MHSWPIQALLNSHETRLQGIEQTYTIGTGVGLEQGSDGSISISGWPAELFWLSDT